MYKNQDTITSLAQQGDPNLISMISQGIEPQDKFPDNIKKSLHNIRVQETTSIGQDYSDEPTLLIKHLKEIQSILEAGPCDLDEKKSNVLKGYSNLLLFIAKF